MARVKTVEEYYTFLWCINVIEGPIKNRGKNSYTIFYEDMLLNFEREITNLFSFLKHPLPNLTRNLQYLPSISTEKDSFERIVNKTQLHAWKEMLNNEQVKSISKILELFCIDFYDEDSIPKREQFCVSKINTNEY